MAVRPSALYLSFLGMAIPLALFRFSAARWSTTKVSEINAIDLSLGRALPLFQAIGDYVSSYMGAALLCGLCVATAYCFALDTFAAGFGRQASDSPLQLLPKRVVRLLVSAPLMGFALGLLGLMAQTFPFVAVMVSILWFMVPVVMFLEGKSTFRALRESLFLRYAPPLDGRRQFAFFRLMSLGFGVYAGLMGIMALSDDFLKLDEFVPISRASWLQTVPGLKLSLAFTLQGIFSSALEAFCLLLLALFTVSLYAAVREPTKKS